jgi:hypothetical protein
MVILSNVEFLQGLLTFFSVIISIILGLIIISRYTKVKDKNTIYIGLAWIFVFSAYWSDSLSFLLIVFFGSPLNWAVYFVLCNALIPIAVITWSNAFSDMIVAKKNQKKFISMFWIITIAFETLFFALYFTDLSLIGTPIAVFIVEWSIFVDIFLITFVALFLITGLVFVRVALISSNEEIKLKGKFLLVAFLSFVAGTLFDLLLETTSITITIARIFLIISSISFYIGFTLPKKIKKALLKKY